MKTFTAISTVAIALTCLLQACPAPPVLAVVGLTAGEAAAAGGAVAGGAVAGGLGQIHHHKRQDPANPDIPLAALQACNTQLKTTTVHVSQIREGDVRFDDVPPACMTLAGVFLGQNRPGQPQPIPMGSASLQYNGLSTAQLNELDQALKAVQS